TATDQITLADLSGLGDGTLTLSVTLTDPSSNVGSAVTASTSKDTTAPAAPVVSSITTDSGANGADGITNDNTLSFNGTAEANATVEVFIDAASIGSTTADVAGQWSFNHETATLTDATYAVTATATDAAGNATSSSALNVTVDTAAPSAPVVDLAASSDSGVSSTDNLTSDNTPTLIGTAEVNAIIEVFINGNSLGTTTADGSGNWSITVGSALGDGVNSVTARATDTAGNSSAVSSTLLIVIDTVVPVDPVVTSPAAVTVNAATQTISGTHPDNGATVHVYADADNDGTADNTTSLANAVISGSVWSLSVNLTADSDNNFVVKAIDGVGNESGDVDVPTITEDSTVPADPVVTIPASGISLNSATQTINGTHAENGITVHAYADANNDGTADNTTSLANAIVSGNVWSLNVNLTADSDNNFVVKATDGAGNESSDVDVPTITEDSTVPADPVVTTPASAISLNAATQSISGTHAENGVTVHAYADADNDGTADNTTSLANAVVSGNAWSLSVNLTADSDNNFVVKATDGAGNESSDVDVPTITEDSMVPTITNVTSSTANGTYGAGDQVSIQVEFSEAVIVNGTGLQLGLETGLDLFVALASGSGTSTLTFDLTIPVGHKTSDLDVRSSADLTITSGTTVKDAAGNSASLALPTGSDANSLATNKDIIINSEPTVTLSVDNSRIDEATGTATLTATLSAASPSDVIVTIAYSGTAISGTDYNNTASTTITVIAGQISADAAVIITPTNDANPETNETIIADITGVTNGAEDGVQQQTITIVDDDSPSVSFANLASSGAESISSTDLTVNTTIASALTVTVDYTVTGTATGGGTDYTLANGTLTFNPGSTSENITIAGVIDDAIFEANETVIVTLSNPTNANLGANTIHTYTITDNDAAAVTIADVSGAENGGAITVTATLDNAVQGGFTVDVSSADGTATTADSDYAAITSQTLTFAGTDGETQTFTVTPTADTKLEANETLTISQANLSATTLSVAITDGATVTITNDDAAAVTIAAVSGAEDAGAITVTAMLDNAVDGAFTVDVSTADGTATIADSDYTAITSQTLTFAGTAGETQTFTVTPTADATSEGNETIQIIQSNLTGTTLAVNISDVGMVTISDDDDGTAPIGYTVSFDDALIGGSEVTTSKFTFAGAEVGTTYNYTVSSDGGGTNV
ncbi:S-layer family protein, partial [Roseivirga sp. E12]|uniref:beta strand repeat-containing protein n=1 Tax=Roseivirga sp. E12 TaxID=2819237 RepID=UPI001ABC40FC